MPKEKLEQGLGLRDSVAIVIGSIIGSGIFLKTAVMAQLVGHPFYVMLAWVVAGFLSLAGALTYAELGGLFPQAGGEYIYLKEAYGKLFAFLYGWMRFWVGGPGTIAAGGVGAAAFLLGFWNYEIYVSKTEMALGIILLFTLLNCFTVHFGGSLQSFLTALKLMMLAFLVGGIFLFSPGQWGNINIPLDHDFSWSAFGGALIAALWAYDGWNNLPMVAAEVRKAEKNIPLALIFGTLVMVIIYCLTNLAYFYCLPFSEVVSSYSKDFPLSLPVGTKAASTFLGVAGLGFLSIAFVISVVGSMNGSIMTSPRVSYAMAKDGLFFKKLAELHPKTHVPVLSILVQGALSCGLAISGTFDQLTDYVVFGAWVFYASCGASVWIFRKKRALQHRPYKVWGYPYLPGLFVFLSVLLLLNTVYTDPKGCLFGLFIISLGIPVYWWRFRRDEFSNPMR